MTFPAGTRRRLALRPSASLRAPEFNSAYKRIRKDWFFHNPTRASVGSLGIVPEVPDDALTSPEYQVWRVKEPRHHRSSGNMLPGYATVLIKTPFFIDLIRVHRVGTVKQRLYVENLLEIPVPVLTSEEQERVGRAHQIALRRVEEAERRLIEAETEVESLVLGTKRLELSADA